jgi:hypothetical protein
MPPVPPPAPLAPYDTVNSVLNIARVRMNDAIQSIGGDVLTNTQPFTQEMTNSAWRVLQSYLANLGYSRFKKPLVLPAFPIVADFDPAANTQLTWTFFFDGANYWYPPSVTLFPSDLIIPLRCWERMTGTNSRFLEMEQCTDRLPDVRKIGFNRYFLWENDTLYMPGSVFSMDLRFEYAAYLPDFFNIGEEGEPAFVPWFQQQVPIMRCKNALAYYICAEAAGPRNDMDADPFIQKAQNEARLLLNVEVSQRQRHPVQRRPYSGHRMGDWRA